MAFTPSIDNKTVFANWTQQALDGKIAKTVCDTFLYIDLQALLTGLLNTAPNHR